MAVLRAAWVLPITSPPIHNGWVEVHDGLIAGIGTGAAGVGSEAIDLGDVALLPSLVNAHTHIELCYLRGAIPPAGRFPDWIRGIMDARRRYPDARDPVILRAAREGIAEAHAAGTGLIGDISNTLVTPPLLKELGMRARVFYELLGFNVEDPVSRVAAARIAADEAARDSPGVRVSLAPHAPYSVSPGLFAAIRADLDAHRDDVSSIHLAESGEEVEFIARGTGPWRELLTSLGVWTDAWLAPAVSPVTYLAEAGFLDGRVLAVHGVQCGPEDLGRLRGLGTTIVSCPRSNRHVGAGDPPLADFYAACVPVAFGTDSLASVGDLNIFTELAGARALAPDVPARRLLESATLAGARALGFGGEMGSIERGKRASLIAARLPADAGDVEEYLLSGIDPGEITWVDEQNPKAQ